MCSERVLLTGSGGFLGCALTAGFPELDIIPFDMTDGDVVSYDFSKIEAQHIIHLAALTGVEDSWKRPADYYRTNVMGTVNMLDYCRRKKASMTYVSTYTYGVPEYLPINEKHPVSPHSVYNHSKYLAEDICKFYNKCFGVSVTVLRLFNLYGPGQSPQFVIPHIVSQALNSDEIEVMSLYPKRDFVFITDVADAIRLSIGRSGFNIYNVGSGHSASVAEICDIVQQYTGTNKPVVSKEIERRNEVMDVVADCTKIKNELGWKPKVDLNEGIKHVIDSCKIREE